MYNLRYHIASLVGVFLALALGLVLGGLVVQRGTVSRQQTALVEGLRGEFATLRSTNAALTKQNEALTSFSEDMSDAWVADRLVGKNVVILTSAGRNDGLSAATDAVESAGGTPIVITATGAALSLSDEDVRSKIASGSEFSSDLVASVATSLAAEWSQPAQKRPVTDALVEAGALTVDGFEPGMAAYGFVDIAQQGRKVDAAGIAIAQGFERLKAKAVVGESASLKTGLAEAAAQKGLASFDTLGSGVGQYTMIALLTGAESGYYGVGDAAVAVYPPPPVE